jgi:hypothetical protein
MRKIVKSMVNKTSSRRIKNFSKKHYKILDDKAIVVEKYKDNSNSIRQDKH